MAGTDRILPSRPRVLGQSQEPPTPVNSEHPGSPFMPLPSIPSKRSHPVDENSDSQCRRGPPQKRQCLVDRVLSGLSHTTTDPLPQFPSVDNVVAHPGSDTLLDEFPNEDERHSSYYVAPIKSDTTTSPGKQMRNTTGQQSTSPRVTEEHKQLGQRARSFEHQAKPFSKRPGNARLPRERIGTEASQKLEPPQRTVVIGSTRGGPYGELPDSNKLAGPKKPPRGKGETSNSPGPTAAPELKGWPLILVCIASFIVGMFIPELRVPEFRPVDWTERAIEIEIALATISRVILFGEASLSQGRLEPGMLPVDGLAHDHDPLFGQYQRIPVRPKWFSNSTEFPQYDPWLTTSAGVYVPEVEFMDDLGVVAVPICQALVWITTPYAPSQDFCFLLCDILSHFDILHSLEYRKLAFVYNDGSFVYNEAMLHNMEFVQEMQRNGSEDLGSDRLRALALHAPTTTAVSLSSTEPPPPSRLPVDTSIPDDIPQSFIKAWHDAMTARSSRLEQEHASTSTPTIERPASSKIHVNHLGQEANMNTRDTMAFRVRRDSTEQ